MWRKWSRIAMCYGALCVFLCSCSLPIGHNELAARTEFTQAELLEDYDQLWRDLKKNYIFFPILEARDINIGTVEDTYRNRLLNRVYDLQGFVILLNDMFRAMDNFAHLSVTDVKTFHIYHEAYRKNLSEDRNLTAWDHAVSAPQTEEIYGFLSLQEGAASGKAEMKSYQQVQTAYYPSLQTAYFRFSAFDHMMVDRDAEIVCDFLESLHDMPIEHIIFDVTGNSGGDDAYWLNNIVMPFGGEYTVYKTSYLKDTPMSQAYFGESGLQPLAIAAADEPLPEFVHQLELSLFFKTQWTAGNGNDVVQMTDIRHQRAKRWVLIDSYTFSSADSFAEFCRQTQWATLIGQSTMGDGGLGDSPCFLTLRNTGLLVRFSITAAANAVGSLNALHGTPPDIYVKPYETPLRACKRLIEGMRGSENGGQ